MLRGAAVAVLRQRCLDATFSLKLYGHILASGVPQCRLHLSVTTLAQVRQYIVYSSLKLFTLDHAPFFLSESIDCESGRVKQHLDLLDTRDY